MKKSDSFYFFTKKVGEKFGGRTAFVRCSVLLCSDILRKGQIRTNLKMGDVDPYRLKHSVRVLGVLYHEITDELLQRNFHEYNELYFYGDLGECRFKFEPPYTHAWGSYTVIEGAKYRFNLNYPIISLHIRLTYYDDCWIGGVILHEMIHMYLDTVLHLNEKRMHGKFFQRVRRFLNKTYHLEIDQWEPSQQTLDYDIYGNDIERNTIPPRPIEIGLEKRKINSNQKEEERKK